MKFFLKNIKKAFSMTELVVSITILVIIFAGIFYFITDTFKNIKDSTTKDNTITNISKFQDEIDSAIKKWYFFKRFSENNYLLFEKSPKDNFIIISKDKNILYYYWDLSDDTKINNINVDEKISKIKAEEIKIKEISVEPKKDENVKNYRIDFTLKNEQNSKTYTLYI